MNGRRWAVVVASLALGAAAAWRSVDALGVELGLADASVGVVLVGCGLLGWRRRPDSRTGPLLAVSGVTWLIGSLASIAVLWHRGPLAHAVLSFPTGRLRRRFGLVVVVFAYVDGLVTPLGRNDVVTLVLAASIAAAGLDQFVTSLGPDRRAAAVALGAAVAYSAAMATAALGRLAGWDAGDSFLLGYDLVVAALALTLLVTLVFHRQTEATVADLVVRLGQSTGGAGLGGQLARTLGDPSLVVGYWVDAEARYVDDLGRAIALPDAGDGRSVTAIDDNGVRLAVLVHDATTLDDPQLLTAVAAATKLAVTNARLQADIRQRQAALAEAGRRIVEAGDDQRRRLEVELSDGAARRLAAVAELLDDARDGSTGAVADELEDLQREVGAARAELYELAQGIRPAALAAGGLAAALPDLVDRAALPVDVAVEVGRLPAAVEAALYFVCSEALTNTMKHAGATRATIAVTSQNGSVTAIVTDDGAGGTDPGLGTGLRGLADRVEALGGRLAVGDRDDGGTVVTATVPVAPRPQP
jgi:signal transduction histidine kinase